MKRLIVAIKDLKLQEYLNLAHVKTKAEAQRHFLTLVKEPKGPIGQYPLDYALHNLGSFNSETGVIESTIPEDITPYTERDAIQKESK